MTPSSQPAAPPPHPLMACAGLGLRFASGPWVLRDFSLSLPPGEIVSLIGPSGCGKTSLLKLAAGLLVPSAGTIAIDGVSPRQARPEIAYVFQDANLLPWLPAAANVELPLRLRGLPASTRRDAARRLLDRVGLAAAARQYPWELSGGMKMRVSLARALSVEPRLMLLDEPFAALDALTRERLQEDLLALHSTRAWGALFVTHSVNEAVFLAARVVVLAAHPGRIQAILPVTPPGPRDASWRSHPEFHRLAREVAAHLAAPPVAGLPV